MTTVSPQTLTDLVAYWKAQGGVNLGVVGDASHVAKGTSYHLGKSQLTSDAYSTKTARDKAGLTEAASAIDLGKLGGSFAKLRSFSGWLVKQAQVNRPGTSDIREIIWSPDGKAVLRWDRERGYASAPKPSEADSSHRTHTHISWYRDAEGRDHTTAFRPYFAPKPAVYRVHIAHGAVVRVYTVSPLGCIQKGWTDEPWKGRDSSALASAPVPRHTCYAASTATTTLVKNGKYRGKHIRVGAGVTVTKE
jgi:hypothetical protein